MWKQTLCALFDAVFDLKYSLSRCTLLLNLLLKGAIILKKITSGQRINIKYKAKTDLKITLNFQYFEVKMTPFLYKIDQIAAKFTILLDKKNN